MAPLQSPHTPNVTLWGGTADTEAMHRQYSLRWTTTCSSVASRPGTSHQPQVAGAAHGEPKSDDHRTIEADMTTVCRAAAMNPLPWIWATAKIQ